MTSIHSHRVESELELTQYRYQFPSAIRRLSAQIDKRTSEGEWLPEDDVQFGGQSNSHC